MVTPISRDVVTMDLYDEKMSSVGQRVPEQSIEEQLEQFFISTTKTQKLFMIDGSKVGIVFDPSGEPIKVGYTTVGDRVALVSDKTIPQQVVQKIKAKIPPHCTYSIVCIGRINGMPFLQFLGLE